jgi:hypothetical protein
MYNYCNFIKVLNKYEVISGVGMIDRSKTLLKNEDLNQNIFFDTQMVDDSKVEYRWERNPSVLKKYINLINERFGEEINLKDSYKRISPNDLESYFYVATTGEKLISGVRVSICPSGTETTLPTEKFGFSYKDFFSNLDLAEKGYCEVTRYAVANEFRNNPKHYIRFFAALAELCKQRRVGYIFLLVSKGRLRLYSPFADKYFTFVDAKPYHVGDWPGYEEFKYVDDFNFAVYKIKS